jgi:hypothetical protein
MSNQLPPRYINKAEQPQTIDFGQKCINCRFFKLSGIVFGDCALGRNNSHRPVMGRVHMFSSCDIFQEMPQELRPKLAQRVDFELERRNFFGGKDYHKINSSDLHK